MAACNYSDKKFLIVDSLKPSRDVLKNLAFDLDAATVHASSYASDVISKCTEQSYDIILLGYDLGERQKNGQQLLEELKATKLINRSTVVMLVTGEMSQAMVLAALEQNPDDYLTKPYTLKELSKRLNRCFQKKEKMHEIYQALDNGKPEQVILYCDKAIDENSPYRTECLDIKSHQFFDLGQYEQASNIYRAHVDIKNCQWAGIGLGRIELEKNNPAGALPYFAELKRRYPIYLKSYDWLATAQEQLFQFTQAEETLEEAVNISPLSVKRVKRYADLCMKNGHFDKATAAFESNYQLSYNSIHHKPQNALMYAHAAIEHSDELSDLQLKMLKNRVTTALNETIKTFNNPNTRIQSQLLTVDLMNKTNEKQFANRLLNTTEDLLDKCQDSLNAEEGIQIAKLLIHLGRRPPANVLLNNIVEKNHHQASIMTEVDKLVDDKLASKAKMAAQVALDNALVHYHRHEYGASISKLEKARKLYPNHLGITLNLVQVLLSAYEAKPTNFALLKKAGALLNSVGKLSTSNSAYQRRKALENKFKRLMHGNKRQA